MTPEQLALLADNGLSDAARVLGMYMESFGPEEREYRAEELVRLLHGYPSAQTMWRHVRQLEVAGYVECTQEQGGKGHGKWYRWIPLKNRTGKTETDAIPGEILRGNGLNPGEFSGVKPPSPSPTTTPPPPTAREDDLDLVRLRKLLAPHDDVLDRFARSAPHRTSWPTDVWATYRPPSGEPGDGGGTEWAAVFAGKDEEVAVRSLVNAMRDYAGKGQVFDGQHFRRYVRSALREIERAAAADLLAATGGGARASPRAEKPPADAQAYHRKPYRGLNG